MRFLVNKSEVVSNSLKKLYDAPIKIKGPGKNPGSSEPLKY